MTNEQRTAVQSIHFFTQQFWLEHNLRRWITHEVSSSHRLGNSTRGLKIRVTMRHTDWWHWSSYSTIGIDPFGGIHPSLSAMKDKTTCQPEKDPNAWGCQLEKLISPLRDLEFEFETHQSRKEQLDTIVSYARTWRFLSEDGMVHLTTEGMPEVSYRWRGRELFEQGWSGKHPRTFTKSDGVEGGC
jgi:hypothetical protein